MDNTYYIKITAEGIQHEQLLKTKEDWALLEKVLDKIKRDSKRITVQGSDGDNT